uniref:Putative secreted protein n=1 Tax=Panstrongylus lignarius TaxID=156445 RepID=A0A224XTC0_9HEMI
MCWYFLSLGFIRIWRYILIKSAVIAITCRRKFRMMSVISNCNFLPTCSLSFREPEDVRIDASKTTRSLDSECLKTE